DSVYRLTWRLPLAGLVAFSHLQFSQIRGRQPYLIVRNILYVIVAPSPSAGLPGLILRAVAFSAGGDGRSGRPEQKQRPLGTPAYGGACTHKSLSHARFGQPDIAPDMAPGPLLTPSRHRSDRSPPHDRFAS